MFDLLQRGWDALVSTPGLLPALLLGWLVYVVWLGSWIVLQKREPAATMSWLLGLALVPYLGFLIYHVFGPQRIRRQRLRREHSRARMPQEPDGFSQHAEAAELARLAQAASGLAPSSATDVRLLVDGRDTYAALLDDVRAARAHVHMEVYIYHADHCGAALRDALIERLQAGVKVRLLIDAIGGAGVRRFLSPLVEAGGEVAWFHPTRFGRIWQRPWLNLRTHRKIAIVDGRVGYAGSINVSDDHDVTRRPNAYRDLHLRIEGDAVRRLQHVFVEDWLYVTGDRACLREIAEQTPMAAAGPISTQVLVSGPDSPWEAIHRVYVGAIHAARSRVWLVTPYFVPGEAARMSLTSAALAGLDVRLLVPRRSDSLPVTLAARSYFDELLEAGVKVYEYGPRMLHSKALLVDDALAIVGSANYDHRSFRLNFELSVLFDDRAVAARLARHIESEFTHAARVRRDGRRPLLRERLPEALARLLSPLL